jgi:hypothetical protein
MAKTDNAEGFRDEAEECRRQAERAINRLIKRPGCDLPESGLS